MLIAWWVGRRGWFLNTKDHGWIPNIVLSILGVCLLPFIAGFLFPLVIDFVIDTWWWGFTLSCLFVPLGCGLGIACSVVIVVPLIKYVRPNAVSRGLAFVLIGFSTGLYLVGACVSVVHWTTIQLATSFWLSSPAQRQCIEQIIGEGHLAHIQHQVDKKLGVGYFVGDDFYVSIFKADQNGACEIEFHEKVWNCYEHIASDFCERYPEDFAPHFMAIQTVELTGAAPPEVYVSFRVVERFYGARHLFYTLQPDGRHKAVLTLELCPGGSSVTIDSKRVPSVINVHNDTHCDAPSTETRHSQFVLRLLDDEELIERSFDNKDLPGFQVEIVKSHGETVSRTLQLRVAIQTYPEPLMCEANIVHICCEPWNYDLSWESEVCEDQWVLVRSAQQALSEEEDTLLQFPSERDQVEQILRGWLQRGWIKVSDIRDVEMQRMLRNRPEIITD